jgi:hypothetical protein
MVVARVLADLDARRRLLSPVERKAIILDLHDLGFIRRDEPVPRYSRPDQLKLDPG